MRWNSQRTEHIPQTLRQAINRLVFEGLLIRKKGYGTLLRENVMSNARNWMSFSQEMHAQGMGCRISNCISPQTTLRRSGCVSERSRRNETALSGAFARTSGTAVRLFHLLFQSGDLDDGEEDMAMPLYENLQKN